MPRFYVTLHVVGTGWIITDAESETACRAMIEHAIKDVALPVGALSYEEIDIQSIVEIPLREVMA